MILRRIQVDLVGPDEWPDEGSDAYAEFVGQERRAKFLFNDHLRIVIHQLRTELPDEFDVEADSLSWGEKP